MIKIDIDDAKSIVSKGHPLSEKFLCRMFNSLSAGNAVLLEREIETYRPNLSALAQMASTEAGRYDRSYFENTYRDISNAGYHSLDSSLPIYPLGLFSNLTDFKSDTSHMNNIANLGKRQFMTGCVVGSYDETSMRKLGSFHPPKPITNSYYQGHLFIGIDDNIFDIVQAHEGQDMLGSLSRLHEHVSHDYIHQTNFFLGPHDVMFRKARKDWSQQLGDDDQPTSSECWHTLAHKTVLDQIHGCATRSTDKLAHSFLDQLEQFKDKMDFNSSLSDAQKHDAVEYLGLLGATAYMRVTGLDNKDLTHYLATLENIDYPEASLKTSQPILKTGPNAQAAYFNYLESGLDLSIDDYVHRQKATLSNFCPMLSHLYSPDNQKPDGPIDSLLYLISLRETVLHRAHSQVIPQTRRLAEFLGRATNTSPSSMHLRA